MLLPGEELDLIFQRVPGLSRIDIEDDEFIPFAVGLYALDESFYGIELLDLACFRGDAYLIEDDFADLLDVLFLVEFSVSFLRSDGDGLGLAYLHADDGLVQSLDDLSGAYDEHERRSFRVLVEYRSVRIGGSIGYGDGVSYLHPVLGSAACEDHQRKRCYGEKRKDSFHLCVFME